MALWAKLAIAVLGLVAAGLGLAIWYGSARWNGQTAQLVERLLPAPAQRQAGTFTIKDLEQLPAPVARYFRLAIKEGQPFVRSVRMVQEGAIRLREGDDRWSRFDAKQYYSAQPPSFVWDATIRVAPVMSVRVRDAYVGGQASMQGEILSLVSIIDERGKPELNVSALQRYLGEAVWFPTALLPGAGLRWSAIDDNTALATISDAGTTVSLEFHFNAQGEIAKVYTPGRYREVNGRYELTPWTVYCRDYQERDGMRIPVEAEVEWQLPGGSFRWWKGRIVDVAYDFAQ